MNSSISKYTVNVDATIMDALKRIDDNQQGFVIIADNQDRVAGTLTDGDVRRFLINNSLKNDIVSNAMKTSFVCLKIGEETTNAIELFKNSAIRFYLLWMRR